VFGATHFHRPFRKALARSRHQRQKDLGPGLGCTGHRSGENWVWSPVQASHVIHCPSVVVIWKRGVPCRCSQQ
jgi:hypothetical protein